MNRFERIAERVTAVVTEQEAMRLWERIPYHRRIQLLQKFSYGERAKSVAGEDWEFLPDDAKKILMESQ